jgi:hypothetical protein
LLTYIRNAFVGRDQELLRFRDPKVAQVIYERLPHRLLEKPHEMPSAQPSDVRSIVYRKRVGIVTLDEFEDRPETPNRVLRC